MMIDRNKICVGECTTAVHFQLEKLLAINVLRSSEIIEYRQPKLTINVRFGIRNSQTFSNFLRHAVSPRSAGAHGKKRAGQGSRQRQD